MNIQDIYQLFIEIGIEKDPRSKQEIESLLSKTNKQFEQLSGEEKEYFDLERLSNPYSDTRILFGSKDIKIQRVIAGIDVETQELLLVDRLNEKGMGIDLVIAHHPEGKAFLALNEVMSLQETMLENTGVPIHIAQGILASRISEVKRSILPLNTQRVVDAARLLNLPMMCAHTPADNQVQRFLEELLEKEQPETVGNVLELLEQIPEYKNGKKIGAGPCLFAGSKERKTGKIVVDMTGGTSGSDKAYERLAAAGVGTIIGMHMNEKHRKEAEKHYINVIIAGHMASDSLGMNLLLDRLQSKGVEVLTFSGLDRIERSN